jgi:plastocyanin
MTRIRMTLLALPILAAVALGGVRTLHSPTAAADSITVSMINNSYAPATLTVAAGTTVIWSNDDTAAGENHDVITEDGAFFSPIVTPGQTTSFTFDVPGTYKYYCDLHFDMFGTIVVQ